MTINEVTKVYVIPPIVTVSSFAALPSPIVNLPLQPAFTAHSQ